MSVFVDTSALYALVFPEDIHHAEAVVCLEGLEMSGGALVSSNYVLLECASLLQRRHSFELADTLLKKATEMLDIIWIGEQEHRHMLAVWTKEARRRLSLVDCSTIAMMKQHDIRQIVAFDVHFVQAGFDVLPRADRVAERAGTYRVRHRRRAHAKTH